MGSSVNSSKVGPIPLTDRPHILVIGAMRACHDRLMDMGANVTLFVGRSRALASDLNKRYRHIVILDDEATDAMIIEFARALHAVDAFDRIASFVDRSQVLANRIAEALSLPVSIESALIERTRDKQAMRRVLEARGLSACKHGVASSEAQLFEVIETIGMPCIVKPIAGEGSRDVRKITQRDDIARVAAEIGHPALAAGMIVEQFLDGDEYSVEAISIAGVHHVIAITKKYKDPETFVEIGHVVPAPLDEPTRSAIETYVSAVLTALGFVDSPSHTEVILTADGPCIVETHTRLGGDRIMDLVQLTKGVDLYALAARQAAGAPVTAVPMAEPSSRAAAVWYKLEPSLSEQIVAEVRGVDDVRALAHVRQARALKQAGARGGSVRASADRAAFVVAVGADAPEAVAHARDAAAGIVLLYRWAAGAELLPGHKRPV